MWFIAAIGLLSAVGLGFAVWALLPLLTRDSDEPDWWITGLLVFEALFWIIVSILGYLEFVAVE